MRLRLEKSQQKPLIKKNTKNKDIGKVNIMRKIKIVSDSASDLTSLKNVDFAYAPMKLIADGKEFIDDDTYVRCMDEALRRTEAYKIENMMGIGYYSHSKGTRIRKVS